MDRNIKTLIVSDVHGRFFWKEPVVECLEKYPDAKIVFLGDYLDPYPKEWGDDPDLVWDAKDDYKEKAIENFKEILELKKQYSDRIILLIGNHDCTYAISTDFCNCRRDRRNYVTIKKLFEDNWNLFQLAYEERVSDKHFMFSHAGIHKGYLKLIGAENITEEYVVNYFNNGWLTHDANVLDSLQLYDTYRGYLGYDYGSLIWADIRSWVRDNDIMGFQIFGHTQLDYPVKFKNFAGTDCRECTYLTTDGNLLKYSDNSEFKEYKETQSDE